MIPCTVHLMPGANIRSAEGRSLQCSLMKPQRCGEHDAGTARERSCSLTKGSTRATTLCQRRAWLSSEASQTTQRRGWTASHSLMACLTQHIPALRQVVMVVSSSSRRGTLFPQKSLSRNPVRHYSEAAQLKTGTDSTYGGTDSLSLCAPGEDPVDPGERPGAQSIGRVTAIFSTKAALWVVGRSYPGR